MANKLTVLASVIAASSAMLSLSASAAESTLDKVLSLGFITCGVSTGLPVFLTQMQRGNRKDRR